MSTINTTTSTSINSEVSSALGGYLALGTEAGKSVVLALLSKSVIKLSASDMKEMNLKAIKLN